jgi:phosphoribosylamine---glycine ligase
MKILVVGGGGREHALAWKLAGERSVREVLCAPGNAGISRLARVFPDIAATDVDALIELAVKEFVDLTVVGPEQPLEAGIVDRFSARRLRIFGPSQAAARLECSKVFAKDFMARHGIPTARYRVCDDAVSAHDVVDRGELGLPVVVKADGLAAGKGVVVAADAETAHHAIREMMEDRRFGAAGARVVLEECLSGPEVSFFALCDGARAVPIGTAQDHKRVFDNDQGPNTGGMGAFAPSPLVDAALERTIMRDIVQPVLAGMRSDGHEYRGFLYAGLMLTCNGPRVIEFNVRFGDPEAQVVLPGVADDLTPRLLQAADGQLSDIPVALRPEKHVGVVLASAGYPGSVKTDLPVSGLEQASSLPGVIVFQAGTAQRADGVRTSGGRVVTIVGRGASFADAIARAYEGVAPVSFAGMQYRKDIGRKAMAAARQ